MSPAASRASSYSVSAISVFVWRKAFGRTRNRSPSSSSSIHASPQSSRVGQVRDLGRLVVDRPVDRAHLGEARERLDQEVRVEALARCGDEHDEHLAGVPALADDEVAEVAGLRVLVVRLEPLGARPRLDRLADRVPDVGREQALLDVDHLVPAAGAVEAEDEAVRAWTRTSTRACSGSRTASAPERSARAAARRSRRAA